MVAIALGVLLASSLHGNRAPAGTPVIVAFGDSLTAGFGLPQDEAFPAQLEKALKARGQEVKVVNAARLFKVFRIARTLSAQMPACS